MPRGTVHAFRVEEGPARLLNLHTPAGFERSVALLGEAAPARDLPPGGWKPPEVPAARREAILASVGMRPLAVGDPFA